MCEFLRYLMFKKVKKFLFTIACIGGIMNGDCSEIQEIKFEFKEGNPVVYTVLKTLSEARDFCVDLRDAGEDQILVTQEDKVGYSVRSVLKNTILSLAPLSGGDCSKIREEDKPFMASVLWEMQKQLYGCSVDNSIYCLNMLNIIANSAFDKALLLLHSQCEGENFIPSDTADWDIISDAVLMLKTEKNGRRGVAVTLLLKLKDLSVGREKPFESVLADWPAK